MVEAGAEMKQTALAAEQSRFHRKDWMS